MNARELREALAKIDDDALVVVRGYESGVHEVGAVEPCEIVMHVHDEWYYGDHERIHGEDDYEVKTNPTKPRAQAVELVGWTYDEIHKAEAAQ